MHLKAIRSPQEMPSGWLSKLDAMDEGDQLLRARKKRLTARTRRHEPGGKPSIFC
jgi:hypothetical protein